MWGGFDFLRLCCVKLLEYVSFSHISLLFKNVIKSHYKIRMVFSRIFRKIFRRSKTTQILSKYCSGWENKIYFYIWCTDLNCEEIDQKVWHLATLIQRSTYKAVLHSNCNSFFLLGKHHIPYSTNNRGKAPDEDTARHQTVLNTWNHAREFAFLIIVTNKVYTLQLFFNLAFSYYHFSIFGYTTWLRK